MTPHTQNMAHAITDKQLIHKQLMSKMVEMESLPESCVMREKA